MVIGGVTIHPGDVIMGDDDGVVVLGSDLDKIQVRGRIPGSMICMIYMIFMVLYDLYGFVLVVLVVLVV